MKKLLLILYAIFLCWPTLHSKTPTHRLLTGAGVSVTSSGGAAEVNYTEIQQADFKESGQSDYLKTYTINSPGYYKLIDTIKTEINSSDTGTIGGNTAIFINANNVYLDLNNRTIYQENSTALHGIEIAASKYNITIYNGVLANFADTSLLVNHSCNNIIIKNVTVTNGNQKGIYLQGTSGNSINDVTIENTKVTKIENSGADVAGIQADYTENLQLDTVEILNITSDEDSFAFYGINLTTLSCLNVYCSKINTSGSLKTIAGFYCLNSNGCTLENCAVEDCNDGVSIGSYGFYFEGNVSGTGTSTDSVGHSCKNCTAKNNRSTVDCYGFYIKKTSNCLFEYCNAFNLHGTSNRTVGFYSNQGSANKWSYCTVSKNKAPGNHNYIAGFEFDEDENQSIIEYCTVESTGALNADRTFSSSLAHNYPFYLKADNADGAKTLFHNVIDNCKAISNVSDDSASCIGFYDSSTTSTTLFTNNFAFNNTNEITTTNYSATFSTGSLAVVETDIGGMNALANIPNYYNISISN